MIKVFPQSNTTQFTNRLINCNPLTYLSNNGYKLGKLNKIDFANGELSVELNESVRNKTIVIVAQPINYNQIFELLSTIDAARRSSAKEIIAVIPNLPHSRQERRANGIRTSISARLFADMLQTAGLDRIITMDVHTTAIEGFYKIPFDNIGPFNIFIEEIKKLNLKYPVFVSPDFGAMKTIKNYAKNLGYNMAFINKERLRPNEVNDMTLIGNVDDQDVIMIDDLIDTGGTILKASDLLIEEGANSINIFATHGIFSNNAVELFNKNNNIDNIFVTNTIPSIENIFNFKINVIDVSCQFHNALDKILN